MTIMANPKTHIPVLLEETLAHLDIIKGGSYIDCTTGAGGHSEAIAEAIGPNGRLLCIDQDEEALSHARTKLAPFGRRVSFVHSDFQNLKQIAQAENLQTANGIILDLGISSLQLDDSERGFAFRLEGPLDMRLDRTNNNITAAELINNSDETELIKILRNYGEVQNAKRIVKAIIAARPIYTTHKIVQVVEQAAGNVRNRKKKHPATTVFLALRIIVNGELDSLRNVLPQAYGLLGKPSNTCKGGRIVVISFHSLEDRIVKQSFALESSDCICPKSLPLCRCSHNATLKRLTKKAIRPTDTEVSRNPRARSAILRAAERLGD